MILLCLHIALGCWCVGLGVYGLREALKPMEDSIFTEVIEAQDFELLSAAMIIIGGGSTLLRVLILIG